MKKITIFTFVLLNAIAYSQYSNKVGINTDKPQKIFHIDGQKDNPKNSTSPNSLQFSNDFLIQEDANIGIGVLPTASNDARVNISTNASNISENGTGFKLKDGTEGDGNVLVVSNTNGDIIWQKRVGSIKATLVAGIVPINSDFYFTGTTIVLPPGKWLIRSSILLRAQDGTTGTAVNGTDANGAYGRLSWANLNADGNTYSETTDAISGNLFGGAYYSIYGLAFGQTLINNNTSAAKTYYLVNRTPIFWGTGLLNANWRNLGGGGWGETSIIAFPAN